jgi:hypothetical protein
MCLYKIITNRHTKEAGEVPSCAVLCGVAGGFHEVHCLNHDYCKYHSDYHCND